MSDSRNASFLVPIQVRSISTSGLQFREVAEAIADYSTEQNVNLSNENPSYRRSMIDEDALKAYATALARFEDAERLKVKSEQQRRDRGPRDEVERSLIKRRTSARDEFVRLLEQMGVVLAHDAQRNLTVVSAPAGYDYQGLAKQLQDQPYFLAVEEHNDRLSPDFYDGQISVQTEFVQPKEDVYLQPERLLHELPQTPAGAHNVEVLFKIIRAIHAIRDLQELQAGLLDSILEIVPAERGAILFSEPAGSDIDSFYTRTRQNEQQLGFNRSIVRRVMGENVAITATDVSESGTLRATGRRDAPIFRSLLCVPITVSQRVIGCIYLDSIGRNFTEDDLQLMAAIAGISSVALDNARRLQWLEQENQRLALEARDDRLVGRSSRMRRIFEFLSRVEQSDSSVLIDGESGTGKELAARALHHNSRRHNKPFVAINCGAIPDPWVADELFGHELGTFTGALRQKKGKLEVADGGVLFLDEIAELSLRLQDDLLRVLETHKFERIGGTEPIAVDIRVIAATHRDLEDAVREGRFREDLYYRLAVLKLTMPPLRERREDIPLLAEHFVQQCARRRNAKVRSISPEAMTALVNYGWPGNVRELENAIERAIVMGTSDVLLVDDLPEALLEEQRGEKIPESKYHATIKELKKELILDAMGETHWTLADAARILGVHPNYLQRLLRNLGLYRTDARPETE